LHLNQVLFVFALDVLEFKFCVRVDLSDYFHVFLNYLSNLAFFLINTAVHHLDFFSMVFSLFSHLGRVGFSQIVQGFLGVLAFKVLSCLELLEFSSIFKHLLTVVVPLLLYLSLIFVHYQSLLFLCHLCIVPLRDLATLKLLLLTFFLLFDFSRIMYDFAFLFLAFEPPLDTSVVCFSELT
jgi:hypothetical protein